MVDASFRQHLRREIPLHRVHLRKGVRYWSAGGEHHAAPIIPFLEITNLQEHVECAIAIGVRQAGNTVHLGRVGQVLVEVGFVYKQLIDTEFFKGEGRSFDSRSARFFSRTVSRFLAFSSSFTMRRLSSFDSLACPISASSSATCFWTNRLRSYLVDARRRPEQRWINSTLPAAYLAKHGARLGVITGRQT